MVFFFRILSSIEEVKKKKNSQFSPPVAVLPLGTGNDLSRTLGWGKSFDGEDLESFLHKVEQAQVMLLDRWKVEIKGSMLSRQRVFTMNNYFGVGVDAHVALSFHKQRESSPELFQSRILNKLWYGVYGGKDMLEQRCKDLPKFLDVSLF